jgi:hypothetical protein
VNRGDSDSEASGSIAGTGTRTAEVVVSTASAPCTAGERWLDREEPEDAPDWIGSEAVRDS